MRINNINMYMSNDIGINEEITTDRGLLNYDKWDKIVTDIKNGTYKTNK